MRSLQRSSRVALGSAALALLAVVPRMAAPQHAPGTPEAFAQRYIATLVAGEYSANAGLMHPTALSTIRRFVVALAARDPSGSAIKQFVGVSDTTELRALADTAIYARFLKATLSAQPGVSEALRSAKSTIIGHLDEGKDITYVLYRLSMTISGAELRKVDVLTLKRAGTEWRAMLGADVENLVARLGATGS